MYTFLIITSNNFSVTVDFYLFKGENISFPWASGLFCVVHSMLYNLKNFSLVDKEGISFLSVIKRMVKKLET